MAPARHGAGDEHAETVLATDRQHRERGRGAEDDVAFLRAGGAEVEAGGSVRDDPGVDLTVGLGGADEGLRRPGAEVPVDEPRVVPRLVGPGAGPFGPRPGRPS